MAINNPRIAGEPFTQRKFTPVILVSYVDGIDSERPDYEGQMYYRAVAVGSGIVGEFYVAVNRGGSLDWVPVYSGTAINKYTGEEWDPIREGS